MPDAIYELCARSKDHPELRKFHAFHKRNPFVLDFLVTEARLRLERGFRAFSYSDLCSYARWKLSMERGPGDTFTLNDHLCPYLGRAMVVLFPELNGHCRFRQSTADEVFGTVLEDKPSDRYGSRLRWADGTALEHGWRPTVPHVPAIPTNLKPDVHARPAQMEE
jgi:hypothetical protein